LRASDAASKLVRYRARVLYDGTDFTGSQVQPHKRAVANALEAALAKRMQQAVQVHCASRTDAGVHARGQAIHFDLEHDGPTVVPGAKSLAVSVNALCPPEVRVVDMEEVTETDEEGRLWHSRLWATGKLYSYRLSTGPHYDPMEARYRHHAHHRPLDLHAMQEASQHLVGELDCAAFANRRAGEVNPRELDDILTRRVIRDLQLVDEGAGRVRADFHVQSALFKMVRNMVGLLLAVGDHKVAPSDVPGLIAGRDRDVMPSPAPAHGLTLESVYYAEGWNGRYTHPLHPSKLCDGLGCEI